MSWDGKMYDKYRIAHTDGTPLKVKKYFVMRLDSDNPVEAARVAAAMRAYKSEPRNCDRFDDLNSAQRHYIEHGCQKGLGMIVDGEIRKTPWKSQFEMWLFSLVVEQKGETDGSK